MRPRTPSMPRQAVPEVDGREQTAKCRCGAFLEFTTDAIGRVRERCPRCHGVKRAPSTLAAEHQATSQLAAVPSRAVVHVAARHPVPAPATVPPAVRVERVVERVMEVVHELPPINPGQMRCQLCARGVEKPTHRFCADCGAERMRHGGRPAGSHKCADCGAKIASTSTRCVACASARRGAEVKRRFAAGEIQLRPKACAFCGGTFQPSGPASKYCEAHRDPKAREQVA